MAQQDYSGLIAVGVIGAAAWYAYEQGWFSGLLPSTVSGTSFPAGFTPISTSAMSLANQTAMIVQMQAGNTPTASIQAALNAVAAAYAQCVSPNTWTLMGLTGSGTTMQFTGGCSNSVANTQNQNPIVISAPSSTPTQPVPVVADPVATSNLVALLLNASGGASRLTIDGWAYYYNALPGKVPITADQMSAMIAANGQITDANRSTYNITPDAFVALLNGQGLSGLGFYAGIPLGAIHGGGW